MTETPTTSDVEVDDSIYVARVRAGEPGAYAELYRRHYPAVLRAARAIAGYNLAEDLAAEAFLNTFRALRGGGGPDRAFRTYVVTAVRHAHITAARKAQRVLSVDDVAPYVETEARAEDPWHSVLENGIVMAAFASLPERWREVLWRREVEGRSVFEVGEMLGLSPGAVAQLSFRAREGLRLAYLNQHSANADEACESFVAQLPKFVRGSGQSTDAALREHLEDCADCTDSAIEIDFAAVLLPTG